MEPIHTKNNKVVFYLFGIFVVLFFSYFLFLQAPRDFPAGSIIHIGEGSSLHSTSLKLKKENIIRSKVIFEFFVILNDGEKHMIPGDYFFENKLPVFKVASRVSKGERHLAPIKVTIPEGFNNSQIGILALSKLPNFKTDSFNLLAKNKQGYLFPDTYFFSYESTEQDLIKYMGENFEKKIAPLLPEIIAQNKTEEEIITMASIIEEEAKGNGDREIISGILWKRLRIGMALEVDAAPETYKKRGLPESPISNPGLLSIQASIHPESSPYLFYLHGDDGLVHYAKTFAEHKINKFKYLR